MPLGHWKRILREPLGLLKFIRCQRIAPCPPVSGFIRGAEEAWSDEALKRGSPSPPESAESCLTTDQEVGRRVDKALERQPLKDQSDKPSAFLILDFQHS
jgi:hypothetical protein